MIITIVYFLKCITILRYKKIINLTRQSANHRTHCDTGKSHVYVYVPMEK